MSTKVLTFIGQTVEGAEQLWDYLQKNIEEVLYGAVQFSFYVSSLTKTWNNDAYVKRVIIEQ